MRKVLIANRGEIAVRIIRACRDAGLASVAVYGEQDLDALHVADGRRGVRPRRPDARPRATSTSRKILKAAADSGRRRGAPGLRLPGRERGVRPRGHRRRADLDRAAPGGDRRARRQGERPAHRPVGRGAAGAGHRRPGGRRRGGGRVRGRVRPADRDQGGLRRRRPGLRSPGRPRRSPSQFESAVREAVAAFGRGECFVERYLDRPRHVETQCLADTHGNVVIVSTSDCSLQRRHQKLVEEAPAPFLTAEQDELLRESSAGDPARGRLRRRRHLRVPGRPGRHRVVPGGQHPAAGRAPGDRGGQRASTWSAQMFRIADGEALDFADPEPRGHSIEFRINAEDPGRGFLPAPGTITAWRPPSGPGVRLDAGYAAGMTVPQAFDSLIAKLIVTGATRTEALERARRALAEFEIERHAHGAAVPPRGGRRSGVRRARSFAVHTRWIETEFADEIPPYAAPSLRMTAKPRRGSGSRSRSAASAWRSRSRPACSRAAGPARRRARGRAAAARCPAQRAGGRPGQRERPGQPDAGHDRQDRGGRRPAGVGR